jgi:hypothetical protein
MFCRRLELLIFSMERDDREENRRGNPDIGKASRIGCTSEAKGSVWWRLADCRSLLTGELGSETTGSS